MLIVPFALNVTAVKAYDEGMELYANEKYELAAQQFEKSSKFKPFDGVSLSYKVAAQSMGQSEKTDREQIVADIDKAEKLAPNNMAVTQNALTVYSNLRVYQVAMDYARKVVELQPMNLQNYEAYFISGYEVVSFYYRGTNPKIAKEIADEVLTIKDFVEELNAKRSQKIEFDKNLREKLMYFQVVSYNVK